MILLLSLAVWRIASILMFEDMGCGFRNLIGIQCDETTHANTYPDNIIGEVFSCFWCLSLVVAFVLSVLVWLSTGFSVDTLLYFPASSTGAIIIERYFFTRYRE